MLGGEGEDVVLGGGGENVETNLGKKSTSTMVLREIVLIYGWW